MKTIIQLTGCTLALSGLFFGVAAHATNLAELPLKASVLAKPNVIWGMDDSGSMDLELLFATAGGAIFWRYNNSTGFGSAWDSTKNRPIESNAGMGEFGYVMLHDKSLGNSLYDSDYDDGGVAPPIAQMAWLRSSSFNALYYNSSITYPAWSPAYVDGALRTYNNVSAEAAPAHPGPLARPALAYNLGTEWNRNSPNWNRQADRDFTFRALSGMVLPAGTEVLASSTTSGVCSGKTVRTLSANTKVPQGASCQASIPYFPATFWQRTVCPASEPTCVPAPDCTVISPTADPNSACVNSPDGVGKLRRYEIKAGVTFTSGRSVTAELQNFANWFTYYRKRKLMMAGSVGRVLENITGLRMGVVPFNVRSPVTMHDADALAPENNRRNTAGRFYLNSMRNAGTPTHAVMDYIGKQFNTNTSVVEFACQRNSMFIMTDGFANGSVPTAPSYNKATYGTGAPYETTQANSLGDLALAFYTNRLRTDLTAGKVPLGKPNTPNPDLNPDLHVTTYALTLGARGKLFTDQANPFAVDVFANPPTWPTPVMNDPSMIDDLWHATVNGRGKMFLARDVESTRLAIQSALDDMINQQGAQGNLSVSSINLARSDGQAYLGSYTPDGWVGNLTANKIDVKTGDISASENWNAGSLLTGRTWSDRRIFSSRGNSGINFSTADVGSVVNPNVASFTNQQVVEYLRGKRAGEGSEFRQRRGLIGPVVNAEPVLAPDEGMVYLASGNGMLHAFDSTTGKEEWAYVPEAALAPLGKSVERVWAYRTMLDATPRYGKLSDGSKILTGGMGAAGRSYYALNVTNPKGRSATDAKDQVRWTFPAAKDTTNSARMGFTIGKPVVTKTSAGDVVVVTSGVDNGLAIGDGKGRLWVLDAKTGEVKKTFQTTEGTNAAESGLSHVAALREPDGTVRYAYGGDLLGNLWQFDLEKDGEGVHNATRVAVFKDANGNPQPVTTTPELTIIAGKRIILIGTGRMLDISDFGNAQTQSFYALADGTTLTDARSGLVKQVYTRGANPELTANAFNWKTDRGWYFDLPAGEQANTAPSAAGGAVAFVTNTSGTPPAAGSNSTSGAKDCSESSYLYFVDVGTGAGVADSGFTSHQISNSAMSSRVTIMRTQSGKTIGVSQRSDARRDKLDLLPPQAIKPTKNAWRELRR